MRICVTGARGMLGKEVVMLANIFGHTVTSWVRPEVDISDMAILMDVCKRDSPDVIINCAAWTDVDGAETNEPAAYRTNHLGARNVAIAASSMFAKLIHVSTDFVYPGDLHRPLIESDQTNPQSVYGASKLAGEAAVLEHCPTATIIRTGYIFGHHGPNLINKIASGISSGFTMPFVTDQWITPTGTPLLAKAIMEFTQTDFHGTYHVSQGGGCTTFEMASYVAELVSGPGSISPTTLGTWEPIQSARCKAAGRRLAKRPVYSVLSTEKFYNSVDIEVIDWRAALRAHFAN